MDEDRKPRVLFVINSLTGGGAERVMATLLRHSEPYRAKYAISLVLLDDEPAAYAVPDWIAVHQLNCAHRTTSSLVRLRKLVGKLQPDLTLSFLTRSNVASAVAAIGRKHPWIISERTNTSGHLGKGSRARITGALVRTAYPRASRVIAVSTGVATNLVENYAVERDNIEVIANPVDIDAIRMQAEAPPMIQLREPYVLAIGRLVPNKNYELLIRAFARCAFAGQLVIAGEGAERARLGDLARELGIGDRVILPGFLANPYSLLKRASIFASSSNVEGFPNALVEALALHIPVVATNCTDGPAEILAGKAVGEIAGLTVTPAGILTPVGDIESYARALDLATGDQVREEIVAGGEKRVKCYSPEAAVSRYWAVIEAELAKSRG